MAKDKKKGGGKIIFLLVLIIIAAAVIFILSQGGFGFGGGGNSGDGVPAGGTLPEPPGTNASDTATTAETESGESTGSTIIVEIAGESIYISGSPCESSEALKEYLLSSAGEDTAVVLRDNHAVKSVYDEAKAVLDELELEYSGETVD